MYTVFKVWKAIYYNLQGMWLAKYFFSALICVAISTVTSKTLKDIPEVSLMDDDLAAMLDRTCDWLAPPRINNGKATVALRRNRERLFLVANYVCNDNYETLTSADSTMFCSNYKWLGNRPACIPRFTNGVHYSEFDISSYVDSIHVRIPTPVTKDCEDNNGGCDHICNQSSNKCECNGGYYVNPNDPSSCKDIDECEESNGGCSQLCNNLPGEFVCSCKSGYEIDESDGKTCLDINECKDSALSWDCEGGCENLIGSYRCLPSTEGILVAPNQTLPEDNGVLSGTIVCKPGFELSPDGRECQDINECELEDEDPKTGLITHRYCEHKCENLKGSFRCHCPEGYNLLDDKQSCALDGSPSSPKNNIKKDDVKTPIVETPCGAQENLTKCAYACQNLPNGNYQCQCPEGYKLSEDQHSCLVDQYFCAMGKGLEKCWPGKCLPLKNEIGFTCECPRGFRSEGLSCQDVDECADGSNYCSHDCHNKRGGYRCSCPQGLTQINDFTCVPPCEFRNNGCEQICLADRGGECSCRDGYRLKSDGKSCEVVKRCQHPPNGKVQCSAHPHKLSFKWNCLTTCNPGYVLQGPEHSTCYPSGRWEGAEPKCVAVTPNRVPRSLLCPALKPVRNGVIIPHRCIKRPSKFEDICKLKCNPGFEPIGDSHTACTIPWGWSSSELRCQPSNQRIVESIRIF
ncbi:fibrillin-2-like isoform X2 [Drosophila rhopaloa]|uniref:Fibrillin-2-like isoform X2 n=1 Tax=Drosophila rhopaloa TaxID=1041015 RepID=A0A6P4E1H1_DRORH|nr:fibrillin-2-like isoform X2 [Drosophila rhopaloa]